MYILFWSEYNKSDNASVWNYSLHEAIDKLKALQWQMEYRKIYSLRAVTLFIELFTLKGYISDKVPVQLADTNHV